MAQELQNQFHEILKQIRKAREKAYSQVNSTLMELYWNVGKYISEQVTVNKWGKGVVTHLAEYINSNDPDIKGFSSRNIWTMKQFYETYQEDEKLPSLVAELS